jgi:short-subunit dehydrogenase
MIRMTKAFLPFLKQVAIDNKRNTGYYSPRIITITSIAGLIPLPFASSYSATKHAAEVREEEEKE